MWTILRIKNPQRTQSSREPPNIVKIYPQELAEVPIENIRQKSCASGREREK